MILCLLALPVLLAGCGGGGGGDKLVAPNYSVVTSIRPSRAPASGGTTVTIKGSFFSGRKYTNVRLVGLKATNVVVVDDNTITAVTADARASLQSDGVTEKTSNVIIITNTGVNYIDGSPPVDHGTVPFTYYLEENKAQ